MRTSNSSKVLLSLSVLAVLLASPVFGQETSAAAGTARVVFNETRHDAGSVNEGAIVVHEFELMNDGNGPLRISELVPA